MAIPYIPGLSNVEPLKADKGAFGKVYKGFHEIEETYYVAKQIIFADVMKTQEEIEEARKDAKNEAKALFKLSKNPHPNIVKYKVIFFM